jgi:hypothetical protein
MPLLGQPASAQGLQQPAAMAAARPVARLAPTLPRPALLPLQADCKQANQRVRVHITLELAWSADKTVQQLGRTHRSNQRQPPRYLIVSSDISGEHRCGARACRPAGALTCCAAITRPWPLR